MERDSFVFYRSFYDALLGLPEETFNTVTRAIIEYALIGKEPVLEGVGRSMFTLIRPLLDANNRRFKHGNNGGRPPKGQTKDPDQPPNPSPEQGKSKKKPPVSDEETTGYSEKKPVVTTENNHRLPQKITTGYSEKKPNVNVNVNVNENVNGEGEEEFAQAREDLPPPMGPHDDFEDDWDSPLPEPRNPSGHLGPSGGHPGSGSAKLTAPGPKAQTSEPSSAWSRPNPQAGQPSVPAQGGFHARLESIREFWNSKGLTPYRLMSSNMRPEDSKGILATLGAYSDEEILKAIENYTSIGKSPDHEQFPNYPSGFPGFMRGGVAVYSDEAKPFDALRIKTKNSGPADDIQRQKDTLARVRAERALERAAKEGTHA